MLTMEQLRALSDEELKNEFEEAFNKAKSDILNLYEELDVWDASELPKDKFKAWSKGPSKKYVNHIVTVLRERGLISCEFYSSNADCYAFSDACQWIAENKDQSDPDKLKYDAAIALEKYGAPATDYVPEDYVPEDNEQVAKNIEDPVMDEPSRDYAPQCDEQTIKNNGGSTMNKSSNKNERRAAIKGAVENRDEVIAKLHEEIANAKHDILSCEIKIKQAKKDCKEEVKQIKKDNPTGFSKAVNKIKSVFKKAKETFSKIFKKIFKKNDKKNTENDETSIFNKADLPYLKLTSSQKKVMLNKDILKRRQTVKLTSSQINELKNQTAQWPDGHENYSVQTTTDGAWFVLDSYKQNK